MGSRSHNRRITLPTATIGEEAARHGIAWSRVNDPFHLSCDGAWHLAARQTLVSRDAPGVINARGAACAGLLGKHPAGERYAQNGDATTARLAFSMVVATIGGHWIQGRPGCRDIAPGTDPELVGERCPRAWLRGTAAGYQRRAQAFSASADEAWHLQRDKAWWWRLAP